MPPPADPLPARSTMTSPRPSASPGLQDMARVRDASSQRDRASFSDHVTPPKPQNQSKIDAEKIEMTATDDNQTKLQASVSTPEAVPATHHGPEASDRDIQSIDPAPEDEQTSVAVRIAESPTPHHGVPDIVATSVVEFARERMPQAEGPQTGAPVPLRAAAVTIEAAALTVSAKPETPIADIPRPDLAGSIGMEPDVVTNPASRGVETVVATPAVEAFRASAAVHPTVLTAGADFSLQAGDAAPHLVGSRLVEWRLEAIAAGNLPTAQASEARPAPPIQAQAMAGQITVAIARTRERSVEIRLDPPELGRVQIRLDPSEDGLRAVILAERPETQEFLRRHSDSLLRDLQDAGYDNVSLGFDAGNERRDGDGRREDQAMIATSKQTPDSAEAGSDRLQPVGTTSKDAGLDIRL